MAPQAKLDDGMIDLLLVKKASALNLLEIFRKTYDGSHTGVYTHTHIHTIAQL